MKSIDDVINVEHKEIKEHLESEFNKLLCGELEQKISDNLQEWEIGLRQSLFKDMPFREQRQRLNYAELDFKTHGATNESINEDLKYFKELAPEEDVSFWVGKCKKAISDDKKTLSNNLDQELSYIRRNEQEVWRRTYEKKVFEWQLKRIQEERDNILKKLKDWLKKIEEINDALNELGVEPGVLWDTSIGTLCSSDISFLKQWAEYLKNNSNVKKLCEMIGRMKKEQKSLKEEIIKTTTTYRTAVPDISSKEEIIGIELGRDIENLVPHEFSLMGDDDTSILFDLKFVENRLMCFSKQGYSETEEELEIEEVHMIEDQRNGPMVICVDTSGSMAGAPENIAKAITLSLSSKAVSQKRNCYLINFSTKICTIDLTPPKGMKDLIDFLKLSFHGGTDIHPALSHGLAMMKQEDYEKADMLVISDFVMPNISDDHLKLMNECRSKKCKFYSLSIGSFGAHAISNNVFDNNWTYEPKSGSINLLNKIVDDIFEGS